MRRTFFILFFIFCLSVFTFEAQAFWVWTPKLNKFINAKKLPKDTPQEQFKHAMKLFEKKEYKLAAEEFTILTKHFKDSHLAPEAQYYAGRSYEEQGKAYPAFQAYQKTVDTYPFTKRIDEIIEKEYNLGNVLYKKHLGKLMGKEIMTDLERAAEIFEKAKENAPFGEYADKAQFRIGECYKKSEQYNEAVKAFRKLMDEYPKSPLSEKAEYEIAQCAYLASLKSDYDQELTDDAIEGFEKIAKDRDGLLLSGQAPETIFLLEEKKAENLFKTAQFYESQKHYKSAAIYYEEILEKYPRSSFGDPARANLGAIGGHLEGIKD